jgi:cytoskeletal protein CcmA (bactofilin family)
MPKHRAVEPRLFLGFDKISPCIGGYASGRGLHHDFFRLCASSAGGVPVFTVDTKPDINHAKLSPTRSSGPQANSPQASQLTPRAASPSFEPKGGPATPSTTSSSSATGTSVIGNDLTLLGEKITIISQNKLQVDGHVRGNVHGKQVIITEQGSVVGMVCAEQIEVRGGVRGSIRAVSVKLHASALVEGDIMHQTLAISEGAQFDGRVRRSNNTEELMPVLDPEAVASAEYAGDSRMV